MAPRPPPTSWPPLITSAHQPRWMPWRDWGVTLLMWMVFAALLYTEGELAIAQVKARVYGTEPDIDANLAEFWHQLAPFFVVVVALVSWLSLFCVVTLIRRRRTLRQPPPPPPPLSLEAEAAQAGMEPRDLVAARTLDLAVAHLDEANRYRIEPHRPHPIAEPGGSGA